MVRAHLRSPASNKVVSGIIKVTQRICPRTTDWETMGTIYFNEFSSLRIAILTRGLLCLILQVWKYELLNTLDTGRLELLGTSEWPTFWEDWTNLVLSRQSNSVLTLVSLNDRNNLSQWILRPFRNILHLWVRISGKRSNPDASGCRVNLPLSFSSLLKR